jgi:uncharacterized membrane protein
VFRWEAGQKRPKTRELSTHRAGTVSGGLRGTLICQSFLTPLLGMAMDAASGPMLDPMRDSGIRRDDVICEVRNDARA